MNKYIFLIILSIILLSHSNVHAMGSTGSFLSNNEVKTSCGKTVQQEGGFLLEEKNEEQEEKEKKGICNENEVTILNKEITTESSNEFSWTVASIVFIPIFVMLSGVFIVNKLILKRTK